MSKKIVNRGKSRPIAYSIERIELIEKKINTEYKPKNEDDITFKLAVDLTANNQKSLLLVKIGCSFSFDGDVEIFSMIVDNEYYISNLKSYIVNKKFSEKGFIEYIADLSLSHVRGIQSTIINGTSLERLFVPVLQLDNVANEPIA